MSGKAKDQGRKRTRKRGGGRGRGRSGRTKAPKVDLDDFWGTSDALPRLESVVRTSPDVTAVVSSLGRPPIPGHETPAEHWFELVYERAAVLAGALAAAGGIVGEDDEILGG